MSISDDLVSFTADVVGVLIGAFLGYLLGLRQQRKIDKERDDKRRKELEEALKAELVYLDKEVSTTPEAFSELFSPLNFDTLFLDLPTFTSIVNSGQLLLLEPDLVRSLRELNTEVHEHNTAQTVFAAISAQSSEFVAHVDEYKKILEDPGLQTSNRLAVLLKVVVVKRKRISHLAEQLIRVLS